jgi:hypothetical protein
MTKNVSCVVFTVSLPEYASSCWEDSRANRAIESLDLFREIVNLPEFEGVPFILLFTKADILPQTIHRVRFNTVFTDFLGYNYDCTAIITYLKNLFMKQYHGQECNKILAMIVNATSTAMMQNVLETVVEATLTGSIQSFSFKMYDPSDQTRMFSGMLTEYYDITVRTNRKVKHERPTSPLHREAVSNFYKKN